MTRSGTLEMVLILLLSLCLVISSSNLANSTTVETEFNDSYETNSSETDTLQPSEVDKDQLTTASPWDQQTHQQQVDTFALLSRLAKVEEQANADRKQYIFKYSELSSQINGLRSENIHLRTERLDLLKIIESLDNRMAKVEEGLTKFPVDLRNVNDDIHKLKTDLSEQQRSVVFLRHETNAQEKRLLQNTETMQSTLREVSKQFSGYATMTFAFAQQTSQTVNSSEIRMKETIRSAIEDSKKNVDRLQTRLDRLDDRTDIAMYRLDVWNTTRALIKCQKLERDEEQDTRIRRMTRDLSQLKKKFKIIQNETGSLSDILYQNNVITNRLTDFKIRANRAIEQLITNTKHFGKTLPSDCGEAYNQGSRLTGVYAIIPDYSSGEIRSAQCRFVGDNRWTVFQNRKAMDVSFNRKWTEYETGFGDVEGDYWLGLKIIHQIVKTGQWKLRIEMWDADERFYYAEYKRFFVKNRSTNYQLEIMDYQGNSSDTLSLASGAGFSAPDFDSDSTVIHCARFEAAGWWMRHCHDSNLNGKHPYGIIWYNQDTKDFLTLIRTRMMIAPLTAADLKTTTEATTTQEMTTPASTRSNVSSISPPVTDKPLNINETSTEFEVAENVTETLVNGTSVNMEDSEVDYTVENSTIIDDTKNMDSNSTLNYDEDYKSLSRSVNNEDIDEDQSTTASLKEVTDHNQTVTVLPSHQEQLSDLPERLSCPNCTGRDKLPERIPTMNNASEQLNLRQSLASNRSEPYSNKTEEGSGNNVMIRNGELEETSTIRQSEEKLVTMATTASNSDNEDKDRKEPEAVNLSTGTSSVVTEKPQKRQTPREKIEAFKKLLSSNLLLTP